MSYTGLELYRGPSRLDGQEIIAILTLHSENRKTGDMCQVWIMRADMSPIAAVREGTDESVCGQCDHRHYLDGDCYVVPMHGPNAVYRSWEKSNYPVATARHLKRLKGRAIRFGAYGDPAAVPVEVWQRLAKVASMTTGYTHQVHRLPELDAMSLLDHCMISVDTEAEALFYQAMGARTFRVKRPGDPLLEGEVYCPADAQRDIQCLDCGMCSGALGNGRSVAINLHGSRAKRIAAIQVA